MKLESKRLTFRKIRESDYQDYKSWFSDNRAMKFIHGNALPEKEIENAFRKDLVDNVLHLGLGTFTVHHKESGEFMGIGRLKMIDDHTTRLSFGLLPHFWKQYYGSEMASILVKYAETFGFINHIRAESHPKNEPSHKILKQNRFKKIQHEDQVRKPQVVEYLLALRR